MRAVCVNSRHPSFSCRHLLQRPILLSFLTEYREQTGRHLPFEIFKGQIPSSPSRRRLRADRNGFLRADFNPRFIHPRADPAGLNSLGFKDMPVGNQHTTLRQQRHQMGGDKVARAIETRLASFRIQFSKPVFDGNVGTDDQHHI